MDMASLWQTQETTWRPEVFDDAASASLRDVHLPRTDSTQSAETPMLDGWDLLESLGRATHVGT